MSESWTTDFKYGASVDFRDVILSHSVQFCNDGCWLADTCLYDMYRVFIPE